MSGDTPSPPISGIILTGFMGAGKTTAGALLAERLRWRFVDSDHVIEARAGRTIAEIFASDGEPAFRAMEADIIRELTSAQNIVIALGGGAVERATTREHLRSLPGVRIVFLDAPFETLIGRCAAQQGAPIRPVLRDRERLAERWQSRLPLYREAHLTVSTTGHALGAVVENIVSALFGKTTPDEAEALHTAARSRGHR